MSTKPARERFFPPASIPRAASRATFAADSGNPLHISGSEESIQSREVQESSNCAPDQLSSNGRVQNLPLNLAGLRTRSSLRDSVPRNVMVSHSVGNVMRPGTADPHTRENHPNGLVPLLAPTPRKVIRDLPSLTNRNAISGSNVSDSLDSKKYVQSFKSPQDFTELNDDSGHLATSPRENGINFTYPMKSNGPQRIIKKSESPQYRPNFVARYGEPSLTPGNGSADDDMNMSSLRGKKRTRESEEIDPSIFEVGTKRFRTEEVDADNVSRRGCFSPAMERPSSGMSSAYRRRLSPEVRDTQLRHYPNDHLELNSTSFPSGPRQGDSVETSEPRSLDKLLGRDCNYYMEQHMGKYEAVRKKWDECSIAEWKAGADVLSAKLTKCLDFAKNQIDKKLKAYSKFNAILDSHDAVLRERKKTMELTQLKLVKDSGSVFQ